MHVVFYSSNSNKYSQGKMIFDMNPSCRKQWCDLAEKFPDYKFTIVMQKPGTFLSDDNGENQENIKNVEFRIIRENGSFDADEFVSQILALKPDIAIAVSYWTQPFDWMSLKDSVIAEKLREKGIRAVCHSGRTSEICFDKWQTHQFLKNNGFNVAKGVYVHHEMFYAERNRNVIQENVYREYVFSQIQKLNYPVVVKDIYGLSSFGMDVVKTFKEAKAVLLSKKNNGDRIVEEFIDGYSFGCEIYGSRGSYFVSPPLINSLNQFGLTSPKQNVKLGPAGIGCENASAAEFFHLEDLKSDMLKLADLLDFDGIAQVDLIFKDGKWYVIEINSRISGMTQTMACSLGISLYELILMSAGLERDENKFSSCDFSCVMNLKFPLLSESDIQKLMTYDFVKAVNKIENTEAKQLREMGYTEVILGASSSLKKTMEYLEVLNRDFPQQMVRVFYENAKNLALILENKN
ncbi:MAG: ATP-grasp domain-containing protein [Treponemataceae bacterium]|nr:ATP-grasp domain-containing protein [Treponemataceae bacterium]